MQLGLNTYDAGKTSIMKLARTPEEAKELARYLNSLDWEKIYEDKEKEEQMLIQQAIDNGGGYCCQCNELSHSPLIEAKFTESLNGLFCYGCIRKNQESYIRDIRWCERCHTPTKIKMLNANHPIIRANKKGYCSSCIKELEEKLRIVCIICGIETIDHTAVSTCNDCYSKCPDDAVVSYHRNRAIALGLPATLTADQWAYAVEYFEHKCAYCPRPYEALEHYMPLSKGGGTTASNCVPACQKCNSRKGDSHPITFERIFPKQYLSRIREYLASVTVAQPA